MTPVIAQPVVGGQALKVESLSCPRTDSDYVGLLSASSTAIATTANVASYAISGFSLLLMIMAVIGWAAIQQAVRRMAKKRADAYLDSEQFERKLLESERFKNLLEGTVEKVLQSQQGKELLVVNTLNQPAIAPAPPGGAKP